MTTDTADRHTEMKLTIVILANHMLNHGKKNEKAQ